VQLLEGAERGKVSQQKLKDFAGRRRKIERGYFVCPRRGVRSSFQGRTSQIERVGRFLGKTWRKRGTAATVSPATGLCWGEKKREKEGKKRNSRRKSLKTPPIEGGK